MHVIIMNDWINHPKLNEFETLKNGRSRKRKKLEIKDQKNLRKQKIEIC